MSVFTDSLEHCKKIITEAGKDGVIFTVLNLQSQYDIPASRTVQILPELRCNSNIRYEEANFGTRYKPKKFFISTPKEKFESLFSPNQFDLSPESVKYCVDILKKYDNEESVEFLYRLLIVIEKLKLANYHKKWQPINKTVSFYRTINTPFFNKSLVFKTLEETDLLIHSPYTGKYKIALSIEDLKSIKNELNEQSIDPKLSPEYFENKTFEEDTDNKNNLIVNGEYFENITSATKLQKSIQQLSVINDSCSSLIAMQLDILRSLSREEATIKKFKTVLTALNDSYHQTLQKNAILTEELKEKSERLDISERFIPEYRKYSQELINQLVSSLISEVEKYFSAPLHQKNDPVFTNQKKVNISKTIIMFQENLSNFRKDKNE